MGIFDRNDPLKISHKFEYIKIRDPRRNPTTFEDVIPSYAPNKSGEEFLKKYLAIVRTSFERSTVSGWTMYLAEILPEFETLLEDESDSEDFIGFMMQGFAMAVCEDAYFKIVKPDLMSECAWEAMKSMQILQTMNGEDFRGENCLNAMLAGYLVARELKASRS